MAVIIHSNGGGGFGGLFPSDYTKMKSTALGDVFPGWTADIIPICITVETSTSFSINFESGQRGYGDQNSSKTINGKTAVYGRTASLGVYCTATGRVYGDTKGWAYSVFLPYFYNFDFDAIKRNVRSGTCTVWLER